MKIPIKTSIFIFFLLIYLASNGGHTDANDGVIYLAITKNIVKNHSIDIPTNSSIYEKSGLDPSTFVDKNGKSGFGYGLLVSILAAPLYIMSQILSLDPVHFVPYFLNSIIMAVTTLVLFLLSKEFFNQRISFILSLVFGVCSFAWAYVTSLWEQPLISLTLLLSVYCLIIFRKKQNPLLALAASIFLGLSIIAHPGYLVLIPGYFAFGIFQLRKHWKNISYFIIGFITILCLQGLFNYIRYGSLLSFGYNSEQAMNHSGRLGLIGLIASPGYGLLIFYPLFVLFPLAIYLFYRYYSKSLSLLVAYEFFTILIFFGTLQDPTWGFATWGPRYFVPSLPLITLILGSFIDKYKTISRKVAFIALSVLGFSINILGVLAWTQYALSYGWTVDALWEVKDSYSVFAWNPHYSPILEHIKLLSSNYLSEVLKFHPDDYHKIGLAPCSYDNYLYCNFGFAPLVVLGAAITIIFIFIKRGIQFRSNII